jgi:hypothetical protein
MGDQVGNFEATDSAHFFRHHTPMAVLVVALEAQQANARELGVADRNREIVTGRPAPQVRSKYPPEVSEALFARRNPSWFWVPETLQV